MARFSTRAILAATRSPEVHQTPSAVPIYQSAAFATDDAAELGDILTGATPGYAYSRIDNPTTATLAAAVAELEGAEAGLAFATGMAAIHAAIVSTVRAGQTIVATNAVYGTTRDLLTRVLAGLGIATEFVDPTDPAAVDAALARTGAPVLYVETVSNPTIVVSDIGALAEIAHRRRALLLVDNTFASPYACRPIERGADLVMHSATKYLSGHADVLAGVVVGGRERVDALRPILVDVGGALAPLAAFLVLRGLPTLALRMERHSETALELAAWLQGQDTVDRVYYPGLPSHPQHDIARRMMRGFGGVVTFTVKDADWRRTADVVDAVRIPRIAASLGGVESLIEQPLVLSYYECTPQQRRAWGISDNMIRLSCGVENPEDLIADLAQALNA